MAIRSHRADGGTVFIDAHAVMGSSCEGAGGVSVDRAFMCVCDQRKSLWAIRPPHACILAHIWICFSSNSHTYIQSGYPCDLLIPSFR